MPVPMQSYQYVSADPADGKGESVREDLTISQGQERSKLQEPEGEADKRRTQGARATEQGGTKELRKTKASRRTASQQVSRAREKEENTRYHQVQEQGGKQWHGAALKPVRPCDGW